MVIRPIRQEWGSGSGFAMTFKRPESDKTTAHGPASAVYAGNPRPDCDINAPPRRAPPPHLIWTFLASPWRQD
jgi:hypothetical protein